MGYYPAKFGGDSHFGSKVIMNLVCHRILKDRVINVSYDGGREPVMVSHHPAKFGGSRHCGIGDIVFLVAKEENTRCWANSGNKFCQSIQNPVDKEKKKKKKKGKCTLQVVH